MKRIIKKICMVLIASALVMSLFSCSGKDDSIRIVHKNFTEQRLMGQVLSVYLESKGFKTTVSELGGSMLCFEALKNGDADLYAEYTGTAYMAYLGETKIVSADETFEYVKEKYKELGLTWFKPLGFNNTYVLSVRSDTAKELNLTKTSDLIPHAKEMIIGCDTEFSNRIDGYPGLIEAYPGMEFKKVVTMDQGLTYNALHSKELDVNVSYATDGRIKKFDLVNLEDDAVFFPPYYCVPNARIDCIEKHEGLAEALSELNNLWSDEDMQMYNLMVDEGEDAKSVAAKMLKDTNMID